MSERRILILGVGNPLMRDEGAGVRVVELLMAGYEFPGNVEVMDAGTMGLMILDVLRGVDRLIIVDAVKGTGHPAGTVLLLQPEDLAENQVLHSLHDMRVVDVLGHAAMIDCTPQTTMVGIQIEAIEDWVLELSAPVEEALPIALAAVLDLLRDEDIVPVVRETSDVDAKVIEALRTYAPMPESEVQQVAKADAPSSESSPL